MKTKLTLMIIITMVAILITGCTTTRVVVPNDLQKAVVTEANNSPPVITKTETKLDGAGLTEGVKALTATQYTVAHADGALDKVTIAGSTGAFSSEKIVVREHRPAPIAIDVNKPANQWTKEEVLAYYSRQAPASHQIDVINGKGIVNNAIGVGLLPASIFFGLKGLKIEGGKSVSGAQATAVGPSP